MPVGGLDLAVAADEQDAVRGRVEDLREADPLRLRLLVEPGVLERGRELIGIGGQETRLDDAERLRRRIVEDEHAEDALVLAHDRVRGDGPDAVRQVRGMHEVGMFRHVAQEQRRPRPAHVVAEPTQAARITGALTGRHPVTDTPAQGPVVGQEVEQRTAGAECLRQLLERAVEQRVHLERAVERPGRLVQERQAVGQGLGLALAPPHLLLAGARLGVEPALLEGHRQVLAERAEGLDAPGADRPTARLVVRAHDTDDPVADHERRDDEPP